MRPLALLLGIVTGSTVAICVGLGLTALIFVLLPEHRARLRAEQGPLLVGFAWSLALAGLAAASFYAELRSLPRRRIWQLALVVLTGFALVVYWPR